MMEGGKSSKSFWQQILIINPYYFALLFLGMFILNISHIVSLDQGWLFSPLYFLFYAWIESGIEILFFMFIGNVIKTYLPRFIYYGYVSLCFLFFILHYIDFILVRFMDMSVFYGLQWVFCETFENFIELLHLTGISLNSWIFIAISILIIIPLCALILYRFTSRIAGKKPIKMTHKGLFTGLCFMPLALLALDFTMTPMVKREDYQYYQRILPWKSTMISREAPVIHLKKPLKKLESEKETLKKVHSISMVVEKKPNIYLFIVESLREDFLTRDTAKNISMFGKENLKFGQSFSNANCTQEAWYSIFHGNYPFHWTQAKKNWKSGSMPLQILKKMGYQVHIYSAAQLRYYGMDEVIFGKNHYLADSYNVYPHYSPTEAWESDDLAMQKFMGDIDKKWAKEGNVFVFFIESTHFNYSWPTSYPTHFTPISEEKTHLRVSNSLKNIELIKNRYRNSIHYVDSLFGKATDALKKNQLYDDAIILFTGDHGEEFFEEGQLFHASHLSRMQTEIPIYLKLGRDKWENALPADQMMISQIDLFPTILDYLIGKQLFDIFDGESIFKENRKGFAISARFNGPQPPNEFFIHDGEKKCIFRFRGPQDLEIVKMQDRNGKSLEVDKELIYKEFAPAFDTLFK